MANEVVAAFIGAGATVAAAGIPIVWNTILTRQAQHLSARRAVLLGTWEGQARDYYVEDTTKPLSGFSARMTFTAVGRTVKAEALIQNIDIDDASDDLTLFGMFYNNDYLQLSYYNKNLARKQLGVVVLGLAPDGKTLRGSYTGYSPRRETIIAGTISVSKK